MEDSPAPGTSKPQSSWDEAQHVVRWSRSSQKRDSYVAAINSSQLTLEKLTDGGKPLTMEEVLLLESRNHGTSNQQDCGGLVLLNKNIDFVLAYFEAEQGKENDEEEKEKAEMREKFEENLVKQGLLLERVNSTGKEDNLVFVLIHTPWDVLAKCAEEMMIRAPVRNIDTPPLHMGNNKWLQKAKDALNIFQLQDKSAMKSSDRKVTAFFSRAKADCFLIDDKETFFSAIDRSRMTHRLIMSTTYSSKEVDEFGISRLLYKGVYIDAYPLHEHLPEAAGSDEDLPKNDRQRLQDNWASFWQWYKYQPLNMIKNYFGTRIAFYFAWLGLYNFMLVVAALVGAWCFIAGLFSVSTYIPVKEICDKNNSELFYMCPLCDKECSYWTLTQSCDYARITHLFDHEGTVFFAIFMSFWATIFLEMWRRRQISLAYEWDMLHFEEEFEPPRPAFVAKATRRRKNPVTGKDEPFIPFAHRAGKFTCAFVVVSFMVLLVIATLVGVIVYRTAVVAALSANPDEDIKQGARVITSLTASILNLVAITVLGLVYEKIAIALTEWEMPRTRTDYQNILTLKLFSFQSVNMYSSLFYIAFFKSSLIIGYPGNYNRINGGRMEGCDPSGCFIELCIQLGVIMVGKQLINSISKFAIPSLKRWWYKRSNDITDKTGSPRKWETDYLLNVEPDLRMFYEYHDMVIQFGFVTMFVAAFPLAPFFALINNVVELRIDAINFLVNFRRPVAERAEGIGVWFFILRTMSWVAVCVNSFVIAFTSEFIPREVYKYAYSPDGSLTGYVNNSLSYFNVEDLKEISLPRDPFLNLPYNKSFCRYKEYFEPSKPYDFNRQYFFVLAVRFIFVLLFQYFVYFTVGFLYWLIPDIPYKLEVKIKRENYIARECLSPSEADSSRDLDARESHHGGSSNSVYLSCENVYKNRTSSLAGSRLSVNPV